MSKPLNELLEQCLDGCALTFATEREADAHAALTGHSTGWAIERVCPGCGYGPCICDPAEPFGSPPNKPECPRCHGSGEIGFNRSPINDPQCAEEATCNVCHGEGVVTALVAQAYELGWTEDKP